MRTQRKSLALVTWIGVFGLLSSGSAFSAYRMLAPDGGYSFSGGVLDALVAVIFLGWAFWTWGVAVIDKRSRLTPYVVVTGGVVYVAFGSGNWLMWLVGLVLCGMLGLVLWGSFGSFETLGVGKESASSVGQQASRSGDVSELTEQRINEDFRTPNQNAVEEGCSGKCPVCGHRVKITEVQEWIVGTIGRCPNCGQALNL